MLFDFFLFAKPSGFLKAFLLYFSVSGLSKTAIA
jgi:hypothetical protein